MANPQIEKGHTQISNEILENIAKTKLNGTQYRIIIIVWRFTYGFKRKSHSLSETFLSKAINIDNRQTRREIKNLIDRNIITVISEHTNSKSREIMFNKDYDTWESDRTKKTSQDKLDLRTKKTSHVRTKKTSPTGLISPHRQDKLVLTCEDVLDPQEIKKENIKENIKEKGKESENRPTFFQKFYEDSVGQTIPTQFYKLCCSYLDDGMQEVVITQAILKGVGKEIPHKYIEKVLNSWFEEKKFKIQDIEQEKNSNKSTEKEDPFITFGKKKGWI